MTIMSEAQPNSPSPPAQPGLPTAERIMDAAERHMRARGYNAVSFRELAEDVGVKSASVHYHFPQKTDLGVAIVARYRERLLAELGRRVAATADPLDQLRCFVELYRGALEIDETICLCAMLAAESGGLPAPVNAEVQRFFQANIDWLSELLPRIAAKDTPGCHLPEPAEIVARLQGAMIVAAAMRDPAIFERVAANLLAAAGASPLSSSRDSEC